MPRKAQVRWWERGGGGFYCWYKGRQHKLGDGPRDDWQDGPNYNAALKAWVKLKETVPIEEAGDCNRLRDICNAHLDAIEKTKRASTLRNRRYYLKILVGLHGDLRIAALKPIHVREAADNMRKPRTGHRGRKLTWGDGTVGDYLRSVHAMLNWAVKEKLIPTNPVAGMDVPHSKTKARERIIAPNEHTTILGALLTKRGAALRRLIVALEDTGARPGELTNARAGDWIDEEGALVYYDDDRRREDEFAHKTSGKRKDRCIFFTGDAQTMVRELVNGKRKGDLLFPNSRGKPYTPLTLAAVFQSLQRRLGFRHLVAYAYRHTFATNWLLAGKPVEQLAALMGNTPATIHKHYSHLLRNRSALRQSLEDFRKTNPG